METLSQFKKSMNFTGAIEFKQTSTGAKVATISTLSNNGQRVKATIWAAKAIDLKASELYVLESEDKPMNFVLCNSKLTAAFSI